MKRTVLLLFIVLFLPLCLHAGDEVFPLDEPGPYAIGSDQVCYWVKPYGLYTATIRYPAKENGWHVPQEMVEKPYPVVVSCSGLCGVRIAHKWIAEHLTSHGYITLTFTPPFPPSVDTTQWAYGIMGGIDKVLEENADGRSPIHNLADTEHIGITGLSMGGAGSIEAAAMRDDVDAVVALAPAATNKEALRWFDADVKEAISKVHAPLQLQCGSNDGMVPPAEIRGFYDQVAPGVPKEFIEIDGGNHIGFVDAFYANFARAMMMDNLSSIGFVEQERVSKMYALAWFDYYLKGKTEYGKFLAAALESDRALSRRATVLN